MRHLTIIVAWLTAACSTSISTSMTPSEPPPPALQQAASSAQDLEGRDWYFDGVVPEDEDVGYQDPSELAEPPCGWDFFYTCSSKGGTYGSTIVQVDGKNVTKYVCCPSTVKNGAQLCGGKCVDTWTCGGLADGDASGATWGCCPWWVASKDVKGKYKTPLCTDTKASPCRK